MIISGIDEAGRGPVLGPMVISILSIDSKYEKFLLSLGIKDSKKLKKEKREELFEKFIENNFDFDFLIISPEEIDKNSLNKIFMEKVILLSNNKPSQTIYLDAPCQSKICNSLSLKLTYLTGKKIIALNKADEKIPVVSAASIVAKVIRDREIEKLHKIYGDFGSGYPSDEKTIKWLKENREIAKRDKILRQKWNLKILNFK
ncbi:MAG: ribonuclease HII [Thermoanaerobaculia bacterium]